MSPEFDAVVAAILDLRDRESLVKAVRQAQYLLERARLTRPMDQMGSVGSGLLAEAPAEQHLPVWRRMLAIQLSGYSGCRVIRGQSPRNSLWIVGRDVTARLVKRVYLPLIVKIEELAQSSQPLPSEVPSSAPRQWFRSWKRRWRMALFHDLDRAMEDGVKEAQVSLNLYPESSLKWEQRTVLRWMKQYLELMPLQRSVSRNKTQK